MGSHRISIIPSASAVLLLVIAAALPLVAAHGGDEPAMSMSMSAAPEPIAPKDKPYPEDWDIGSYYNYPGYNSWMIAHIALMIVAWTIVLPTGKLSLVWLHGLSECPCPFKKNAVAG